MTSLFLRIAFSSIVLVLFPLKKTAAEVASGLDFGLDLEGGGWAVNYANTHDGVDGKLQNASQLPEKGPGFVRIGRPAETYGAGHMLSLIQGAAAVYEKTVDASVPIHVGAIAVQFGGPFRPHSSHQNGLDVDLLYMGQTKWKSVLDESGEVSDRFDIEKNWKFWRLLQSQKIERHGKRISIVKYIFVHPKLKATACDWAREKRLLENPMDAELMSKISPLQGHDDHMHVRIRCSPQHPLCLERGDPGPETGC